MTNQHLLLTSIGAKVPLLAAARKALQRLHRRGLIVGGDRDDSCIGRHFCDDFIQLPAINSLDPGWFAEACRSRNVRYVLPTRDGDLAWLALHREQLAFSGIQVIVSPAAAVQASLDKLAFARTLEQNGLPAIPTAADPKQLRGSRLVVKERYGAGSRSIGLGLDRRAARRHGKGLQEAIFQPMIQGEEFSVDLFIAADGTPRGAIARHRDRVEEGEARISTTLRHRELEDLALAIARVIGIRGHAVIQILQDKQGHLHPVECNARLGGASTLSIAAGLDSIHWSLRELYGTGLTSIMRRKKSEFRLIRHWQDRIEPLEVNS